MEIGVGLLIECRNFGGSSTSAGLFSASIGLPQDKLLQHLGAKSPFLAVQIPLKSIRRGIGHRDNLAAMVIVGLRLQLLTPHMVPSCECTACVRYIVDVAIT